jgi:hypothetical protein
MEVNHLRIVGAENEQQLFFATCAGDCGRTVGLWGDDGRGAVKEGGGWVSSGSPLRARSRR